MTQELKEIEVYEEKRNAYWAKKLVEHVAYLKAHSPFYSNLEGELNHLSDISKFPFTSKDDIAERNEDFLAIPLSDVRDYSATSGTLGDPVSYYISEKDLQRLAQNEKGSLEIAGCTADDVFQLMTTIDKQFMAGFGLSNGRSYTGCRDGKNGPRSALYAVAKYFEIQAHGAYCCAFVYSILVGLCGKKWHRSQLYFGKKDSGDRGSSYQC